jgi:hypothetical protein
MELIFTDKNTKGISELLETVRNNSFGDFNVDPNALTVVITGTVHEYFYLIWLFHLGNCTFLVS